ncbi:unnamed protein product, partial [Didymodactylos carnosus]
RELRYSTIDFQVIIKSNYKPAIMGEKIEIRIPTPKNTCRVQLVCLKGKAKHKSSDNAIIWKLKHMMGMKEYQLDASIELTSASTSLSSITDRTYTTKWTRQPISMSFQVPFTASGFK